MNSLITKIWSLAVMMSQSTATRLETMIKETVHILKQWGRSCSQESEMSPNVTRTFKARMIASSMCSLASALGKILVRNCLIKKRKRKRNRDKVNLRSGKKRELIKKERKSKSSKKRWRRKRSKAQWPRSRSNNKSLSGHSCSYSSEM